MRGSCSLIEPSHHQLQQRATLQKNQLFSYLTPHPSQSLYYMLFCNAPGMRVFTKVCRLGTFQPVSFELRNQRAVLFPQQSRIVCTHTTSCITAINHVVEITISTRQLQRAVERSNWILLIFPPLLLLGPGVESLRQTNLEGWGKAIKRRAKKK